MIQEYFATLFLQTKKIAIHLPVLMKEGFQIKDINSKTYFNLKSNLRDVILCLLYLI